MANNKYTVGGEKQMKNLETLSLNAGGEKKNTNNQEIRVNERIEFALNEREEQKEVKQPRKTHTSQRYHSTHGVRKNEYAAHKILEEAKSLKQHGKVDAKGNNCWFREKITLQQLIEEFKIEVSNERAARTKGLSNQVQKMSQKDMNKGTPEKVASRG